MNPYRRDILLSSMLSQGERFIGQRDELEWLHKLFAGLFRDYVLGQAGSTLPQSQPAASRALDERELTDLEKQLLALLWARSIEPLDRDTIVEKLYGVRPDDRDARQYDNRIDALIFRLRGKLDQQPVLIESIRGQGYRLAWTKSA